MNYFNYFTEIEEEFVRRRGSHMLVSPMDWALIETWRQRGIPLRVALRGIGQSFDIWDQKPKRGRKVNSLFYCQQAVEEAFEQYVESRVGGNGAGDEHAGLAGVGNGHAGGNGHSNGNGQANGKQQEAAPFSIESIRYALHEHVETLARLGVEHRDSLVLGETFDRAARRLKEIVDDLGPASHKSLEQLDADLGLIEEFLLTGLRLHVGEEECGQLSREGDRQLKEYRKGMSDEVYEQTLGNWVARRLRERFRVPRLSLFYLS
jgi:hypothetical protein